MAIQINRVSQANVYLNGASFLGAAEEITLPVLKQMMVDHNALGMVGQIELPSNAIDKMEATFKWNSFYPEVMRQISDTRKTQQLQVRSLIEKYTGGGLTDEVGLVHSISGIFKEVPFGSLKKNDASTHETKMTVYYYKAVADGVTICEVDIMNNIYKVADVDLLSRFRDLIGG